MTPRQLKKAIAAGKIGPGTVVHRNYGFLVGAAENGRVVSIGPDEYGLMLAYVLWPGEAEAERCLADELLFPGDGQSAYARFCTWLQGFFSKAIA